MIGAGADVTTLPGLDPETVALVRLSAAISAGDESEVRMEVARAAAAVRPAWMEEVLLQSYLFAGFPRMLNAAREWRLIAGRPAPGDADDGDPDGSSRERGEATCKAVYGRFYPQLREHVRALHPAIDAWMIEEGYGKVLGRPGLDLPRRELCIIAACVAGRQDRQLHSHLHGAMNVGAPPEWVEGTLEAVADYTPPDMMQRARILWARVRGQ